MQLKPPFIITARLCPGLRLADDVTISFIGMNGYSEDGRQIASFVIDWPGGEHHDTLRSGVGGFRCRLQDVFSSFLAFLDNDLDTVRYAERGWLPSVQQVDHVGFPMPLLMFLQGDVDNVSCLRLELEEADDLILEAA